MPTFKYVAKDASGKQVSKTMEAKNESDVKAQLRSQSLQVISVTEEKKNSIWNIQLGSAKPRIGGEGLVIFTRQFSTMISAGIPVLECLDILEEQAEDPGFKKVVQTIVEDVRSGLDLSAAIGKHHIVFDRIYINMIKAGEASGQLDTILGRLADYMEATEQLKREIKGAMTYPVVSLVMILGITIFLLVFIIPKFASIFDALGVELPLPTKIVMGMSAALTDYLFPLAMITVGLVLILQWWKSTDSGGYMCDRMMLKAPVFGELFQKIALSRFAKTFATLLRSGVPILGALDIVSATAGNRVVEEAVENAKESIRAGDNLAKPLSDSPVFPPMVVRMIAIGEKSGALEQLLEKISEFYDQQVEAMVESLTSLIEPLMIGVMGLIVGGIVLSVFLPIFKIQEALRKK
ncbi:MAG: type II secretion system F family protein [Planctomycetes bacterium]|nr:type II secretion system F family protein [Planctomycetota bacterium]